MNTNHIAEAIQILISEIEVNFIQRTDSPAKMLLWERKVSLLDELVKEAQAA